MRHYLVLFALIGLPIASLCLGLSRLPLWTVFVCPVIEIAWWLLAKLTARPNDMEHAYVIIGVVFALASAIAWVSGRTMRWWVIRSRDDRA
jgi:hypothetical protein